MIRQLAPGYAQGLTSAKGYPRFSDPELALTPRAISLATRRVELALAMCVPARPTASRTYQSEDGGGARREPRRIILLKNSSHPEDLAAALPIVSRITPDGYGVQAQVLKQLILFTMMKKTMNGTCSKLKIEIIPKTHRVVRLEIIQQ